MKSWFLSPILLLAIALSGVVVPSRALAAGVIGTGTPGSCTDAAFNAAIAGGGSVTFNCGPAPHTISVTTTKNIAANTTIDGGGLISLRVDSSGRAISVSADAVTLKLANITLRDNSAATPFNVGGTMYNRGTANLSSVTFLNNNRRGILNQSGTLTVERSRFDGNTTSAGGAAISTESGGTTTLRDSTFANNKARDSQAGGALYNGDDATMTIIRSVFTGNTAGGGGAILNFGTLSISDSTFSGNTATNGGAIQVNSNSQASIVNTTISGNSVTGRGGGFFALGPVPSNVATFTNVTLANDTAPATVANQGGGNIALAGGNVSITLRNTLVANPGGPSVNCITEGTGTGTIVDGGNNLQFPGTSCGATIPSADPKLGALENNGGLTMTHALAADSPARNAAANAVCPGFDQRGVVRPQGGTCDIGAFEYGAVPILGNLITPCGVTSRAFTLVVTGSNFIPGAKGAVILFNGTPLATNFVNPTQLSAVVPLGSFTAPAQVAVRTPVVDGGTSVEVRTLTVCLSVYLPLVRK